MKFLLALPLALTLASCGGDAAKPAATTPLDLPKIGLKGNAPAGSTAGAAIGGGAGHMVQGPGLVVAVEVASDSRPKTLEDGKKEADVYTPKNMKDEKLADGWAITYDNVGGMGKNYFVNVRREIDGKSIWCGTTASTPEQATAALDFCKSLKK